MHQCGARHTIQNACQCAIAHKTGLSCCPVIEFAQHGNIHDADHKATQSSKEEWHVEAEVEAGWGFGSAKVSGGGSGEYQSGREEFAKLMAPILAEAAQAIKTKKEVA